MTDPNTVRRIVSALGAEPEDRVVEIGPGPGAMTSLLVKSFHDVHVIEVDERAVAALAGQFPTITIHHADVLGVDWNTLAPNDGSRLFVIGNIPYNISSQIIFNLLGVGEIVRRAVLTTQREVAFRLVAKPRTKAYGILSVLTQLYSRPEILFKVSRNVFYPKPEVESSCVALDFDWPAPDVDREILREVVRTAFNQRRKTLRNSLKRLLDRSGVELAGDLFQRRAEELTPSEFVQLAKVLEADRGT